MARNRVGVPYENPTRYTGPGRDLIPIIKVSRQPTTSDARFPLGQFWIIGDDPTTGAVGDLWYLSDFISGTPQWVQLTVGAGGVGVLTVTGDDAVAVSPDGTGNLDLLGSAVANATNAQPIYINGDAGANSQTVEVQVAAARTGAPGGNADAGICSFDDTVFSVDGQGYVTLSTGAGPIVDGFTVDDNTGPGTNPVIPTAAGLVTVQGAAVAAQSMPVETHSRAANTYNIEVQVASDRTGAPANTNDAGLCSFDDTSFTVDANGYVTFAGGTGAPTLQIVGDQGSGNVPSSGAITVTGDTVANATHAKPVYVDDTAASASTIDVQVAAAISSAPGDKNDAGLASFDSGSFSVDTDGFVQLSNPNPGSENANYFWEFLSLDSGEWSSSGSTSIDAVSEGGHPGIVRIGDGTGGAFHNVHNTKNLVLGGTAMTVEVVARLTDGSITAAGEYPYFGLMQDQNYISTPGTTDGVYFVGKNTSANWYAATMLASSESTTDTGIAMDTSWHIFKFVVNAAANSVTFSIDGSDVATITTTIPLTTTQMLFVAGFQVSNEYLLLDAMKISQPRADV